MVILNSEFLSGKVKCKCMELVKESRYPPLRLFFLAIMFQFEVQRLNSTAYFQRV